MASDDKVTSLIRGLLCPRLHARPKAAKVFNRTGFHTHPFCSTSWQRGISSCRLTRSSMWQSTASINVAASMSTSMTASLYTLLSKGVKTATELVQCDYWRGSRGRGFWQCAEELWDSKKQGSANRSFSLHMKPNQHCPSSHGDLIDKNYRKNKTGVAKPLHVYSDCPTLSIIVYDLICTVWCPLLKNHGPTSDSHFYFCWQIFPSLFAFNRKAEKTLHLLLIQLT